MQRAPVCIRAEDCIISCEMFKVQIIGQVTIYNRSIEGNGSLPQHEAEVTIMLKDMDFGVYGKGIDGYIRYSLAKCINRREFAICTDFFRHFAGDFLPPCRDSLPPRQFS